MFPAASVCSSAGVALGAAPGRRASFPIESGFPDAADGHVARVVSADPWRHIFDFFRTDSRRAAWLARMTREA